MWSVPWNFKSKLLDLQLEYATTDTVAFVPLLIQIRSMKPYGKKNSFQNLFTLSSCSICISHKCKTLSYRCVLSLAVLVVTQPPGEDIFKKTTNVFSLLSADFHELSDFSTTKFFFSNGIDVLFFCVSILFTRWVPFWCQCSPYAICFYVNVIQSIRWGDAIHW